MWDLPRPGFDPASPALAGGFLTTGATREVPQGTFLSSKGGQSLSLLSAPSGWVRGLRASTFGRVCSQVLVSGCLRAGPGVLCSPPTRLHQLRLRPCRTPACGSWQRLLGPPSSGSPAPCAQASSLRPQTAARRGRSSPPRPRPEAFPEGGVARGRRGLSGRRRCTSGSCGAEAPGAPDAPPAPARCCRCTRRCRPARCRTRTPAPACSSGERPA